MKEIHTVFGAGQIGTLLARALAAKGHDVRLVRRSPPGEPIVGVTWMQGDVLDPSFADEAARGARTVYNCTNPAYDRWETDLEPLYSAVWGSAARAGARLVQLDCLYMYGRPDSIPFDERAPERPCSRKGEIRKRVIDSLRAMHERGEVEMVIGRASDFFGPGTEQGAVFRPDVYERVRKGSSVFVLGDPDQPHGYSYTPDVAAALAVLGTHPGAAGRVWHLPLSARGTTRETFDAFAAAAGTRIKIRRVPEWALRAVGVVSSLVREIAEMTYQWDVPYVPDDSDFVRTFGMSATPLPEAIAATLELSALRRSA